MENKGHWVIASALFSLILIGLIAGLFGLDGGYAFTAISLGAIGLLFFGIYVMVYRD